MAEAGEMFLAALGTVFWGGDARQLDSGGSQPCAHGSECGRAPIAEEAELAPLDRRQQHREEVIALLGIAAV
jgi:hypothetical protein